MAQIEATSTGKKNSNPFQLDKIDPEYLMRDAFSAGLNDRKLARDIFLAWIMRIPSQIDPAQAASAILENYEKSGSSPLSEALSDLINLLRELTGYNACRRMSMARKKRARRQKGPARCIAGDSFH